METPNTFDYFYEQGKGYVEGKLDPTQEKYGIIDDAMSLSERQWI